MNSVIVKNLVEGAASITLTPTSFESSLNKFEKRSNEYAKEFNVKRIDAISKVMQLRVIGQITTLASCIITMLAVCYLATQKNYSELDLIVILLGGFSPLFISKLMNRKYD